METPQKERKRNKLATVSLISILASFYIMSLRGNGEPTIFTIVGLMGSIIGGIMGVVSLRQIRKSKEKGTIVAWISIFLGLTFPVLTLCLLLLYLVWLGQKV